MKGSQKVGGVVVLKWLSEVYMFHPGQYQGAQCAMTESLAVRYQRMVHVHMPFPRSRTVLSAPRSSSRQLGPSPSSHETAVKPCISHYCMMHDHNHEPKSVYCAYCISIPRPCSLRVINPAPTRNISYPKERLFQISHFPKCKQAPVKPPLALGMSV